ncbi:MAG: TIGR02206 family membrane protein [Verrucomicrobiota bacterium]|nr:TIGR02206 family membrane protein [Verrucomicrobiota bacterium]
MEPQPSDFQAYSAEHLVAIFLTVTLPFLLAEAVRHTDSKIVERAIVVSLLAALIGNYIGYLIFVRRLGELSWPQMLPMQMCDWAMAVILVALWTGNRRWFEVAYFWGIGGTLQALLTPNLRYSFPDMRFISFFVAHSGIIIGVIFLMLTRRLRPYPMSIVRAFAWSEVYFVVALTVDLLTGVNYGFLLHKPEAFSLLSYLSDSRPAYLLQMHLLALIFFALLYLPFAINDLLRRTRGHRL